MSGEPGLGEQALSKIAEVGINSQLDEVEELSVDIRTDPIKVIQGEVDSVTIEGKGMVIQQDLRMEKLEISTDTVAIDPLSVVFGNIELTQPANAEARIVLTQSDLNRALDSDFLRSKLKLIKLEYQGKPMTVDLQRVELELPGDGKILINADFLVLEEAEQKHVQATCRPKLNQVDQRIELEILSAEGQGLTPELSGAIFDQVTSLLDLKNFELPGMSLHLKELDVQVGQIVMCANTQIEQIPSA
ncbi:MAG: DUF2993 domain-containing protein [Leptolyngbyaceae cyanobacterium bins.349]|nr:DUF2993 domain-containing protein [Leptolyngbyaceae cyanobacterium bins.349]